MPKRIPIIAARQVAEAHGLKQVVLLGFDGELTHVVTWGATKADCEAAAKAQDFWKGAFAGVVRAAERYRAAKAGTAEEREASAALLRAALTQEPSDNG